jgi:hypothetical protein
MDLSLSLSLSFSLSLSEVEIQHGFKSKVIQNLKGAVLKYCKTCSQARVHSFSISPCTDHSGSVAAFSSAAWAAD